MTDLHAEPIAPAARDGGAAAAASHPAPARGRVALGTLLFGLLGAPAAWSVQTLVDLPLSAHACFPNLRPLELPVVGGVRGIAFGVSLAALVVCIAAAAVAWRSWTRTREEHQGSAGRGGEHAAPTALLETGEGRTRFMALSGVLASAAFLIASLVHTAAVFMVHPCA